MTITKPMTPCRFTFDDSPVFDGYAHGSTWNGFDNVAVTPAVLAEIVAYFRKAYPDDPDTEQGNLDLLLLAEFPMENGLISLGWGYVTQIVSDDVS